MKKRSLKAFDKQSINGLEERLHYRILDLEAALTVQKKLQELNQAKIWKKQVS